MPIRIYIYAAIALAIAGLIAHDHYLSRKYKAEKAANAQLEANLIAERTNTRLANESAQRYASRLAISRGPRSPPDRIMCKLPAAKAPARAAAASPNGTAPPDDPGVLEDVDIGPLLDVPFRACEQNLIQLEELQRWVAERK